MCRAAGCTRSTERAGNPDRFALCPTCTDRLLAGRAVMSTPVRGSEYNPPLAASGSGGPVPAGSRSA